MVDLERVERPTLLLDRERACRNIERMVERARLAGTGLRPHFKTHQSRGVGRWFRDYGVRSITVSSVDMALYFAEDGWDDITIAFPLNPRQLGAVDGLSQRIRLGLLVDSISTVEALAAGLSGSARVWIEIDVGHGRSGVRWDRVDEALSVARAVLDAPRLELAGVLTHAGQTYQARGADSVRDVAVAAHGRLARVRAALQEQVGRALEMSVGDTPSLSVAAELGGADEARPGNFVFYDGQQLEIGACREEDIACAVACPVVAVYPSRGEVVLYGGAVHLSKDVVTLRDGRAVYGLATSLQGDGWGSLSADNVVAKVSQEHGVAQLAPSMLGALGPGDLVAVVPAHICLTVNLLRAYLTLDGERIEAAGGA